MMMNVLLVSSTYLHCELMNICAFLLIAIVSNKLSSIRMIQSATRTQDLAPDLTQHHKVIDLGEALEL